MAKKQNINISTLPNGYALKVDGHEYMYFNQMDLLAGFMVHIGLQENDYMDKGNILTMLFQTMIGEEWEKNVASLHNHVLDMEDKLSRTITRLEQTANTGDKLEPRINEMDETLKMITESIDKQKKDNRQSLMDVRESSQLAKDTAAEFKRESKSLRENIIRINKAASEVREMRIAADQHTKKIELLERRLENCMKALEKASSQTPSKRGRPKNTGGRAKNDEAVLAEIERQDNSNLK